MDKWKLIGTTARRRPVSYRGVINSRDYNQFQNEVVHDITSLAGGVNTLFAMMSQMRTAFQKELDLLRGELINLKQKQTYEAQVAGTLNSYFAYYTDFRATPEIVIVDAIKENARAMLDPKFGQITLPMRQVQERFFSYTLGYGAILPPTDLTVQVTSKFAKEGSVEDWEFGGKVMQTDPLNAFTGGTESIWLRKVEFPLNSTVDYVECELTVTVPRKATALANLLEIIPVAGCDLRYVGLSPDLSDSYSTVDNSEIDTAPPSRFHFAPTNVAKMRIRLRQRRWVEEDGKKVFYYGLQEVSLKKVEYDRSYTPGAPFGVNNTVVIALSPPEGYYYDRLVRIDLDPPCLEDTNKYVRLQLATSLGGTPSIVWDSQVDVLPQRLATPLPLASSQSLYAIFELRYVDGTSETFESDTTPFVRGLGLTYQVAST